MDMSKNLKLLSVEHKPSPVWNLASIYRNQKRWNKAEKLELE